MPLLSPDDLPTAPPDRRLSPAWVVRHLAPFASARRRQRIEQVLARRIAGVTVLLERLYDPHNGAAVLRSAEGLGLSHLHVVPFDNGLPLSRRVTQGSDKWLNIYLHRTGPQAVAYLQRCGFACWAALPPPLGGQSSAVLVPTDRPVALVFGNEHDGLAAATAEVCDGRFHLPMYGFSESFNLSVSVALALAHQLQQRRAHLGRAGDLPGWAVERLRAAYYAQAVNHASDLLLRQLSEEALY